MKPPMRLLQTARLAVPERVASRVQASSGRPAGGRGHANPHWHHLATRPPAGPGQALPGHVRAPMERRLGWDLSPVRVHCDGRAEGLGARAYTRGTDLHFAAGEYAPDTAHGRSLLGHELVHVVQQSSGRVRAPAQAMGGPILDDPALEHEADVLGRRAAESVPDSGGAMGDEAGGPGEPLAQRLRRVMAGGAPDVPVQRKVRMPPGSDLPSFHQYLKKDGDVYSYELLDRGQDVGFEIFTSMFHSPRVFALQGGNGKEAEDHLMRHLGARKGVVEFARKKKYAFTGGRTDFKMNPKYWEVDKARGTFWRKEGAEWKEAHDDINENPELYRIGCAAASKVTIEGGGLSKQVTDTTSDDRDWVPGEGGYIRNDGWNGSDAGLEGENIIYLGLKQFWGHFSNTNAVRPYTKWYEMVESWNGSATLTADRQRPIKGLKS
ncbi:MAG: DUF4157 domain-containing protein [Verrucomicrobiae bacterium]|nr:DUF4157 domain-containing protein [Verrucomicrobiae bacterium]